MRHIIKHKNDGLIGVDGYTRQKAISCMCTECEGWEGNVRDCTVNTCPLWPYRRKTHITISER